MTQDLIHTARPVRAPFFPVPRDIDGVVHGVWTHLHPTRCYRDTIGAAKVGICNRSGSWCCLRRGSLIEKERKEMLLLDRFKRFYRGS